MSLPLAHLGHWLWVLEDLLDALDCNLWERDLKPVA